MNYHIQAQNFDGKKIDELTNILQFVHSESKFLPNSYLHVRLIQFVKMLVVNFS